jgi:hypothetical protein
MLVTYDIRSIKKAKIIVDYINSHLEVLLASCEYIRDSFESVEYFLNIDYSNFYY